METIPNEYFIIGFALAFVCAVGWSTYAFYEKNYGDIADIIFPAALMMIAVTVIWPAAIVIGSVIGIAKGLSILIRSLKEGKIQGHSIGIVVLWISGLVLGWSLGGLIGEAIARVILFITSL